MDTWLLNGSVAAFGSRWGEYDAGRASGWDVAGAGFALAGNVAMMVAPGGEEAKAAELAEEAAAHAGAGPLNSVFRYVGDWEKEYAEKNGTVPNVDIEGN
ncbi:MAG: hypothetical protein JO250_05930 [Armatimonadetes bacterium]|nr:hypothetical protein [Armatimonadota bacterium]